jgi:hypothetical protein
LLLEGDAPEAERVRELPEVPDTVSPTGESTIGEIATAVSEWLATVKDRMEGHDRFQHAVARNALGMIVRQDHGATVTQDRGLAQALMAGERDLSEQGLLASLKRKALDKLAADIPKYPALAVARAKWEND